MGKKAKKNFDNVWKNVNIEGPLDSGDFEGFAGLEVLENYSSDFVKGGNKVN